MKMRLMRGTMSERLITITTEESHAAVRLILGVVIMNGKVAVQLRC